jgi:tetratricopeptide (TPR) repeat protein
MKRPGEYVIAQPYGPDKHSPTFRSCPPRVSVHSGWQRRGWVSSPRFTGRRGNWGYWVPSRPAITYAPSYYSGYGWSSYGDDWATGYEQGRYDADHDYIEYIAAQRAGRLINQWADQFDQAILMFRDGQYERAALNMLGAAEMNHTDGASRLHAGHALFALGRYDEAIPLIERAFELAPVLTYHSYDIRDEYGDKAQFDAHLQALEDYVAAHPSSAGAVTLLGYVTYYTDGPGAAYPYLKRAAALDPRSLFIPKLLTPSSMVRPSTGSLPPPQQIAPPTSGDQPGQDKAKTQTAPWQSNRSGQVVARSQ